MSNADFPSWLITLELFDPFAPMRRAHVDPPLRVGMRPAARNPTAGEDERVMPVFVVDGEFKIAVERCGRNWSPHNPLMRPGSGQHFDLDQENISRGKHSPRKRAERLGGSGFKSNAPNAASHRSEL